MAELIYITAATRENTRHTHVAKCERIRSGDGAALNHITSPYTLCGQRVLESRVFSDAWKQYTAKSASSCCAMCMDIMSDERIEQSRAKRC